MNNRDAPYFEMRLKPLRKLCKRFYRKEIPQMGWTMELISLFEELKVGITSSPVLARFDADKPTFGLERGRYGMDSDATS